MGGGGHDVGADQGVLHHVGVQQAVVAPGPAEPCHHPAVGRGQQDAGPARQVGDAQRLHLLGPGVVHPEAGNRQLGQQHRRRGQGVEGGQELPISDEPAEHLARQVMGGGHADPGQLVRRRRQRVEYPRGPAGRHHFEQIRGDPEDRPVVDPQDLGPLIQHLVLRHRPPGGRPQLAESGDIVGFGDSGVEHERVGDDRHRHAGCLFAVLLLEHRGHTLERPLPILFPKQTRRRGHAALEGERAGDDEPLRQGGHLHEAGQRVDPSLQPPRGGEADDLFEPELPAEVTEQAVFELRIRDAVREVPPAVAEAGRHADRNRVLDHLVGGLEILSQPSSGFVLDCAGGAHLGLDDHRRTARVEDQDVRLGGRVVQEHAGRFCYDGAARLPARMAAAEGARQLGVDHGLGVAGHTGQSTRRV